MKDLLLVVNIILSIVVVVLILIQGRGGGLGSAWGGGGEMFQTRRGMEKIVLWLTFAFIGIFFIVSIVNLFVK